jgi:hypothetical protein
MALLFVLTAIASYVAKGAAWDHAGQEATPRKNSQRPKRKGRKKTAAK